MASIPQNGIVAVRVNGSPLRIKGEVKYSLGGNVREPVEGPTGLATFKVVRKAAFIEVISVDAEDVSLEDLQSLSNQTVTAQLENGKTIVLNEASTVGQIEVSTDEGEFTLRLVGPTAKEI